MHDRSHIVIWSAVTLLFLFTFINRVNYLVLCPVAFLPLIPFTLFVSLRAPRLKIKKVGVGVLARIIHTITPERESVFYVL